MWGVLFGWRKASKCKKLVRAVQCRLKLLRNKRDFIVNQLTEDVAQLLEHGFRHIAFRRVEQLVNDKTMVEAYDLLDQYCEFIVIHLFYIRKHKDCPNDINEAVSTLIFSSSRFGELPELRSIRKLFGQRYGRRFVMTALELLPGNLVNPQMKGMVGAKNIPDDVKYRMLEEIDSSRIRTQQLFLQCKHGRLQDVQATKGVDQTSSAREVHTHRGELQLCIETTKAEGNNYELMKHEDGAATDNSMSSADVSLQLPEETAYLDDIQEFMPPLSKNGHLQDLRLFIFTSFSMLLTDTIQQGTDINIKKQKLYQETGDAVNIIDHRATRWTDKIVYGAVTFSEGRQEEDDHANKVLRSNSFVVDNGYSSCRHIHPKLPDYDELAAKFAELKRANLLRNKQKY